MAEVKTKATKARASKSAIPADEKPRYRVKAISQKSPFMQEMNSDPFALGQRRGYLRATADFASAGGSRGPETKGLVTGPSTTVVNNAHVARARSRWAVLTNPHAKRAVDILVSNVVGTGHRMLSTSKNKAFKKLVEKKWNAWCRECDSTGQLNFGGLEALTFRSMIEGGDCFVRLRPRRPEDNLTVPLQIQLYEAEQVPLYKNEQLETNIIIAGVEFNQIGRPVAYHFLPYHPGEFTQLSNFTTVDTIAIPASNILHVHEIRRPNDVRGMPFLSAALIKLSDLDRYADAEMVRKKAAAIIGGFIRSPLAADTSNPFISKKPGQGPLAEVEIESLEPGSYPILPPGYDVTVSQPADVGATFAVYIKHVLSTIAVCLNVTYEQLTGDLKDTNDRTLRASLLEFKRIAEQYQRHTLQHQFCDGVFDRWFDLAVASGVIEIPEGMEEEEARGREWIADPWPYMNPQQEVTALKEEIRAGLKTRSQALIERGLDPETVDQLYAEDIKRVDSLGLVFDTDPRKVSDFGQVQTFDPNAVDETSRAQDNDNKNSNNEDEQPPAEPAQQPGNLTNETET